MKKEKLEVIKKAANGYKKLPSANQMFILGYMQGVLSILNGKHGVQNMNDGKN